jgi:hypothetical protein
VLRRYARAWRNPVLLLPTAVLLLVGDTVAVEAIVDTASTRPTYKLHYKVLRGSSQLATNRGATLFMSGVLEIDIADLYPKFVRQCSASTDSDSEEEDD